MKFDVKQWNVPRSTSTTQGRSVNVKAIEVNLFKSLRGIVTYHVIWNIDADVPKNDDLCMLIELQRVFTEIDRRSEKISWYT